jgi:RHS repeat-associated protein
VYGNGAQRTLSYDAAGRLTGTGTNVGAATITGRGYALDAVGRRTGYVDETAANAVFSYDPAGQVLGGTVPVPGQPASVNTYAYDPEGNRTQSSTGIQPAPADPVTITGSTTYTANPLNQYTAITGNPNPTYDADGNLLSGLRSPLSAFTCTWNGENRMLSSTSANVAITDRHVENAYDALGRRVRKTVKFASTGAVIEDRYFIYDGWNVIEETIAPATGPVETAEAVWGTDLSGTAQGAGGVGGLLLRESSATGASYYHYDGNGNVTALTSAAGTIQAAYTYGPFGETLRAAEPLAQGNPWRFSTKYQDDGTGLLYYGYRFYNPTDGRWPSRDSIEEDGGINLYGFSRNDAINLIDYLGNKFLWFNGSEVVEYSGKGYVSAGKIDWGTAGQKWSAVSGGTKGKPGIPDGWYKTTGLKALADKAASLQIGNRSEASFTEKGVYFQGTMAAWDKKGEKYNEHPVEGYALPQRGYNPKDAHDAALGMPKNVEFKVGMTGAHNNMVTYSKGYRIHPKDITDTSGCIGIVGYDLSVSFLKFIKANSGIELFVGNLCGATP